MKSSTRKKPARTKRATSTRIETLESRVMYHAGHDHGTIAGTGLLGQYFDNKDFTNPKLTRTDASVNFAWGYGSPAAGVAPDTFSVRWTGQLLPILSESYTFSTTSDDGVRLWVNGKLVIDKLINQPAKTYASAPVALVAGEAVDVRMDYFDNTGGAQAKLMWAAASTAREIIPQSHLFPGTLPPLPPLPPPPPPPPGPTTPTTPPVPGAQTPVRIDAAGSKTHTDADGKTWIADKFFSGGTTSLGLFDIAQTSDDVMFATRRIGKSFGYAIPIASGDYKVNLRFADASYAVGGRKFNVAAEGKSLLSNFDITADAGGVKGVAVTKSFDVSVTDGTLNLAFAGVLNNATVSAIEIVPAVAGPQIEWKTVAANPLMRAEALGAVVNGKLYVLGGFTAETTGTVAQVRCDVYDPASDTWTRIADEPTAITHAGVVVDGTVIYLIGGYVGNHPGEGTAKVHGYDTATDTWFEGPSLPEARGASTAAIVDRKIHLMGGMNQQRTEDRGEHWVLDLNNPELGWVAAAPLANARNHISAAALNGKIYAIGGQHSQEAAQDAQSEVNCYDPATDTWTRVADLPVLRSHTNTSTFVMDGRIIVLGGESGYNLPQSTIYAYDPATNTWSLIGLLPGNRSTSVAGVIGANQIITSTGNTPMPSATTWIGTLPVPPPPVEPVVVPPVEPVVVPVVDPTTITV